MKDSFSFNECTKTGQLLLCPNCQFRVSIINSYLSSLDTSKTHGAKYSSQLSVNSICHDKDHKLFSNDYINGFNNSVHCCVNHEDKAGNYCTKCNCFYCDTCADEHEKQKTGHIVSLFMEKSNKRCYKHDNEIASFRCKECNEIFCNKCNEEHIEHNISNELVDKDKTDSYKKEMLLDIKKQQIKQIEILVKQLLSAKEEIQFEISEIEDQISN